MVAHLLPAVVFGFLLIAGSECHRYINMGCYKENSIEARLMSGDYMSFRGTLIPERCIHFCRRGKFSYAGLQYGFECFCSMHRPSFMMSADPSDCNASCEGDESRKCGGPLRLSVYDVQNKPLNYVQSNYLGCFSDYGGSKQPVRDKVSPESFEMTPEICLGYCYRHGYRYSGIQYEQCFCADEITSDKVDDGDCDYACAGDPRLQCGGRESTSVYHTSITDLSDEGQLMGCFPDSAEGVPLLSGYSIVLDETNSPRRCMNMCMQLSFKYSGVKNGTECYCGNKRPDPTKEVSENECLEKCPNSRMRACGGTWRVAVHSTAMSSGQSPQMHFSFSPNQQLHITSTPSQQVLFTRPFSQMNPSGSTQMPPSKFSPLASGNGGGQGQNMFTPSTKKPSQIRETPENIILNLPQRVTTKAPHKGTTRAPQRGTTRPPQRPPARPQPTRPPAVRPPQKAPLARPPPASTPMENPMMCKLSPTEYGNIGKPFCEGDLIFHEPFDSWNSRRWKHEVMMPDGPDFEFVFFDDNRENLFLKDSVLRITPTINDDEFIRKGSLRLDKCTGKRRTEECERTGYGFNILPPIRSSRISTKESFIFRYGKVVIRARLPAGDWLVPEIWLEPRERAYGDDYASGRIKLALSLGNKELMYGDDDIGCKRLVSGIWMGTENRIGTMRIERRLGRQQGWDENFHNFTLIWKPSNISFQVDNSELIDLIPDHAGKLYRQLEFDTKSSEHWDKGTAWAPFDQRFFISLGVSVGGMREFPDNSMTRNEHMKPWANNAVKATLDFWEDRENWYPTWNDTNFGLAVSDVWVFAV